MLLDVGMEGEIQLLLHRLGQPVAVGVMQMHVERLQPPQHRQADAPGGDGADVHALEIIGPLDAVGDVPAALHHPAGRRGCSCARAPRIIITTCSDDADANCSR